METLHTITRLEESLWRTETRLDPELMQKTFADDVMEFGQSGGTHGRQNLLSLDVDTSIDAVLPLKNFYARH